MCRRTIGAHVKVHQEMVVPLGVRPLRRRNGPRPRPPVVRLLAVRPDLLALAEELEAPVVLPDPVDGTVEVSGLALGREDIREEEVADDAGQADADQDEAEVERLLRCPGRLLRR